MQSVGVVGSGTMATGIIEVVAKAGYDVTFIARSDEKVANVEKALTKSLDKQVERGRLEQSVRDEVLGRVTGASSVEALGDVDLVIEAVIESLPVKEALFADLGRIAKPGAVLATTTSSLPVIKCAQASGRPADVVGMHFFNPATVMKLVEVVSTVSTAPDVAATVHAVTAKIKKTAVSCTDRAGFIVNALLFPYLNDAVSMLEAHYAPAGDIDTAVKAGLRLPDGSLRAAGRRRQRRLAGHRAGAAHRVPRPGARAGAAPGAPGHRRVPRPQDRSWLPRLRASLILAPQAPTARPPIRGSGAGPSR